MTTPRPAGFDSEGVAAREQLRELVAAYTHRGDSGQLDAMVELFEPDAILDAFGTIHTGRAEIRGFFDGVVDGRAGAPRRTFVRHHISNVMFELLGDGTASGASYWVVYSDNGFESSGRYRDSYRRADDGSWRFRSRKIRRDEPRTAAT